MPKVTALRAALLLAPALSFCFSWAATADEAEGYGAASRGGSGGRAISVTNLADRGPGSLRAALQAAGPRRIDFAVEGVIELASRIVVRHGRVTVDGSTAPGDGITIARHGIQFVGDCDDIIVRHLRIRVFEGGSSGDCLLFWGRDGGVIERVLIDHCSLMWATDENLNTWGDVRDLTCQWTIIAEGQTEADHAKGSHSAGWLSGRGSDRVTIHHCLFAHNGDRSPRVAGGVYAFVNNVVYNWTNHNATKVADGARIDIVSNHYAPGPQSSATGACILPADPHAGTRLYLSGNVTALTPTGSEDQWPNVTWYERVEDAWVTHRPAPDVFRASEPFTATPERQQSAEDAYADVLARAGAAVRDADDLRVIQETRDRSGRVGRGNR
jgi:pectate lyase